MSDVQADAFDAIHQELTCVGCGRFSLHVEGDGELRCYWCRQAEP